MPLDRRTRATLRSAEFGFLGVIVLTCRHTPFFCGQPCMAGCLGRLRCGTRGFFTSWLMVGIVLVSSGGESCHLVSATLGGGRRAPRLWAVMAPVASGYPSGLG